MKKTGLNGYVYDFSVVDYDAIETSEILNTDNYLMKKNNIKYCLNLFKNFSAAMLIISCTLLSANSLKFVSTKN